MSKLCLCDGPPCRVVGKNTVSLCRVNSYSPLKDCRTWCSRSKSSSCSRDGLRFFVRSELTGLAFSAPFSSLARPLDALFLDVRLPTRPLVVLHVHSQRSGKSAEDKNDASLVLVPVGRLRTLVVALDIGRAEVTQRALEAIGVFWRISCTATQARAATCVFLSRESPCLLSALYGKVEPRLVGSLRWARRGIDNKVCAGEIEEKSEGHELQMCGREERKARSGRGGEEDGVTDGGRTGCLRGGRARDCGSPNGGYPLDPQQTPPAE